MISGSFLGMQSGNVLQSEKTDSSYNISLANKASDSIRNEARNLIDKVAKNQSVKVESNDKDYVFIHFILTKT